MKVVALDTMVLSGFAKAGLLDVLGRLLAGMRAVTTRAVLDELRDGAAKFPALEQALALSWLEEVNPATLVEMGVFAEYARLLVSGVDGNVGESTVLAWAEVHGATVIIDENKGRQAGIDRHVDVKGSLGLLAHGIKKAIIPPAQAAQIVDALLAARVYLPCNGANFFPWAEAHGLLVPPID
jgi:predicted nucleic acid-binding protein